jgi:hypothetical protein
LGRAESQHVEGDDELALVLRGDVERIADLRERWHHGIDGQRVECHQARDQADELAKPGFAARRRRRGNGLGDPIHCFGPGRGKDARRGAAAPVPYWFAAS